MKKAGSPPANRFTRPPYRRMARIDTALQADRYPTCPSLARELEVSVRTIQRDLDFMRDEWKLPIQFDRTVNGYRYTEPVDHFPLVQVTEGEVFAVLVAQKVMAQYKGTPFEPLLTQSLKKLATGLEQKINVPLLSLDDAITFKASGTAEVDVDVFRSLHRAVVRNLEVCFRYKRRGRQEFEKREVQPYFLHGALNAWYLIGWDKNRGDFRVFALQRMRDVVHSKNHFARRKDVSPETLLKNSLGVHFASGGLHEVRIRFDADAAELVRERRWHESQRLTNLSAGAVELTLTLSSLFEVEQWVLGWGSHAEVLAPPALREKIAEHVRAMEKVYLST